jgi:hypothetical protein
MLTTADLRAFSIHKVKRKKGDTDPQYLKKTEENSDAFSVTSGCSSTVTSTCTTTFLGLNNQLEL